MANIFVDDFKNLNNWTKTEIEGTVTLTNSQPQVRQFSIPQGGSGDDDGNRRIVEFIKLSPLTPGLDVNGLHLTSPFPITPAAGHELFWDCGVATTLGLKSTVGRFYMLLRTSAGIGRAGFAGLVISFHDGKRKLGLWDGLALTEALPTVGTDGFGFNLQEGTTQYSRFRAVIKNDGSIDFYTHRMGYGLSGPGSYPQQQSGWTFVGNVPTTNTPDYTAVGGIHFAFNTNEIDQSYRIARVQYTDDGTPDEHITFPHGSRAYVLCGTLEAELKATPPVGMGGNFTALGVQGNRILCGALGEDTTVVDSGALYVFERENITQSVWTQIGGPIKTAVPANVTFPEFGGIYGDFICGAAFEEDNVGAAYAFRLEGGTYVQKQKIQPGGLAVDSWFGSDCKIFKNTMVIGAPGEDNFAGAVYVYITTDNGATWTQQARLTASNAEPNDFLGFPVAIFGDTIVASAGGEEGPANGTGAFAGAVYVWTRVNGVWTEQPILRASDALAGDTLGYGLSIQGTTIVAGAPFNGAGKAYVFERVGGVYKETAKLTYEWGESDDHFGASCAVRKNRIVIGVSGRDDFQTGGGLALIYDKEGGNWVFKSRLEHRAYTGSDRMGHQVFMNDIDPLMVISSDGTGSGEGSALVFQKCDVQRYILPEGGNQTGSCSSLQVQGDTAIVGGLHCNTVQTPGRSFIIKRNKTTKIWEESQVLVPPFATNFSTHGQVNRIYGNTCIMGGYKANHPTATNSVQKLFAGAVEVWERPDANSPFEHLQRLDFPEYDGFPNHSEFGGAIDLYENTIIATSWSNAAGESVRVFKKNPSTGMFEIDQLIDNTVEQWFPFYVSLHGNLMAVAATGDPAGAFEGRVRIYRRENEASQFVEIQSIAPIGSSPCFWGTPCIIRGDTLFAGGYFTDIPLGGGMWIYRTKDNWDSFVQEAVLRRPNPGSGEGFGYPFPDENNNNLLVVGSEEDDDYDDNLAKCGALHLFKRTGTTWTFCRTIRAPDRNAGDELGGEGNCTETHGSLIGGKLMVGCVLHEHVNNLVNFGTSKGCLYEFDLNDKFECPTPGQIPIVIDDPEANDADVEAMDAIRRPFDSLKSELVRMNVDGFDLKRTVNAPATQSTLITKERYDELIANAISPPPKTRTETVTEEFLRDNIDTLSEVVYGKQIEDGSSRVSTYSGRRRNSVKDRVPADGIFDLGFPLIAGTTVRATERPGGAVMTIDSVDFALGVITFNAGEVNKLFQLSFVSDDFIAYFITEQDASVPSFVLLSEELLDILLDLQL